MPMDGPTNRENKVTAKEGNGGQKSYVRLCSQLPRLQLRNRLPASKLILSLSPPPFGAALLPFGARAPFSGKKRKQGQTSPDVSARPENS